MTSTVAAETTLTGKGMYLWVNNRVEGGREDRPDVFADRIAQAAKDAKLTHVIMKVADGPNNFNRWGMIKVNGKEKPTWIKSIPPVVDHVAPVASALRQVGVQVWGWSYVYGENPIEEAKRILENIEIYDLDGIVINFEVQWKGAENVNTKDKFNKKGVLIEQGKTVSKIPVKELRTRARVLMGMVRQGVDNLNRGRVRKILIAGSSFKYPSLHSPIPFDVFFEFCDILMPQVYWIKDTAPMAPAVQLAKSIKEHRALAPGKPIVPTGSAYGEHGWFATPDQVKNFLDACVAEGLDACNFWEWDDARGRHKELWPPLATYLWPGQEVIVVDHEPHAGEPRSRYQDGWMPGWLSRLKAKTGAGYS